MSKKTNKKNAKPADETTTETETPKPAELLTVPGSAELDNRVALFFRTQPFGTPATFADMMLDVSDKELETLIPKEQAEAIIKRMENDKFELPKGVKERFATARGHAAEQSVARLVRAGVLTQTVIDEPGGKSTGYTYTGPRETAADPVEVSKVRIDRIKVDPKNYQMRKNGSNQATVDRYTAVADQLPALDVFDVGEEKLILVGGFTRIQAMANAGMDVIPVHIHKGTKEEAKLWAIADNATHGVPRTLDDIKEAVGAFLSMSKENRTASVASIASAVKCAWGTADKCKKHWYKVWNLDPNGKVRGKDGKEYDKPESKTNDPGAVPAAGTPATPAAGDVPAPTGKVMLDKNGTPVPEDFAAAFADTRLYECCTAILQQFDYLRNLRPDGYAVSSILFNDRAKLLNDLECEIIKLRNSTPFAVTPADANEVSQEFSSAVRRRWMDKEEYADYTRRVEEAKRKATQTPAEAGDLYQNAETVQPAETATEAATAPETATDDQPTAAA